MNSKNKKKQLTIVITSGAALVCLLGYFFNIADYRADSQNPSDNTSALQNSAGRSVRLNNYNDWSIPKPTDSDYNEMMSNLFKMDEIIFAEGKVKSTGMTPVQAKTVYNHSDIKIFSYYTLASKSNSDTDWRYGDSPNESSQTSPLNYNDIVNNDWWLRDGDGNIVKESDTSWFIDVGKSGVKEAYLSAILSRMSGKGYTGVVFDYWQPAMITRWITNKSLTVPTQYNVGQDADTANDSDQNALWYTSAWQPFASYVVQGLKNQGYDIIGVCIGEYSDTSAKVQWDRTLVDGQIYEQGVVNWWSSGGGWLSGATIAKRIEAVYNDPLEYVWVDDGGLRDVISGEANPNLEQKRLASLSYYYLSIPNDQSRHSYHHSYNWKAYWYDLWDFDIGIPSAEKVQQIVDGVSKYAWSRKYSNGLVLLNYGETAGSTGSITFTLDQTYQDINNKQYSGSITLAAHTGLILQTVDNKESGNSGSGIVVSNNAEPTSSSSTQSTSSSRSTLATDVATTTDTDNVASTDDSVSPIVAESTTVNKASTLSTVQNKVASSLSSAKNSFLSNKLKYGVGAFFLAGLLAGSWLLYLGLRRQ